MPQIYVAEIAGTPVLALSAESEADALENIEQDTVQNDLMTLESEDGALPWDGEAPIEIREADNDERQKWRDSRDQAVKNGLAETGDNAHIAYLVELLPDEDDEPEEEGEEEDETGEDPDK